MQAFPFPRIKKIVFSEISLALFFSAVILFLSFFSLFYYLSIAPKGSVFPLFHNHAPDFNLNISYMRQAYEGKWLITTRYTSEVFPGKFVYITFIFLGKAAKATGLSLSVVYNLSRFVFGALFIFFIYRLIKLIYPDNSITRKLAFFLTIFGTGFWTISNGAVTRFLSFWTEIDILERFAYIPHHLSAKLLMLVSILFLYQAIKKRSKVWLLVASVIGIFCGLSSPFVLVNLEIILVLTAGLIFIFTKKRHESISIVLYIFSFIVISSLSLFYLRWVEKSGFPWTLYLGWEKQAYPIVFSDYLLSLGPNLFFALFAIPLFLRKKTFLHLLLLSWIIEPLIGIFLFSKLSLMTNVRFLSGVHFVPLGIMASLGLLTVADRLARLFKIKQWLVASLSIMALTFIFSVNIWANLSEQIHAYRPGLYNIFIPVQVISGFDYLSTNTPADSVVLAQGFMANLIPAHTHNKVVFGHLSNTDNYAQKAAEAGRFFDQNDPAFGRDMLAKYKVDYVFYSLDTDPPKDEYINSLGLKKVFGENRTVIYQVER